MSNALPLLKAVRAEIEDPANFVTADECGFGGDQGPQCICCTLQAFTHGRSERSAFARLLGLSDASALYQLARTATHADIIARLDEAIEREGK